MKIFALFLFILLAVPVTSSHSASDPENSRETRVNYVDTDRNSPLTADHKDFAEAENKVQDFVEGTTRLLEEWKERRSKMGNPEDVILVAGNTGAGKTTMTKFISGQELEAYKLNRKILIRDREGDISTNTTVVSKTIFPDLIMDRETNTAFFDLPGFYDTRNVSIEIANAFFMKQVAQSAKRVKFLFVVNHASLEEGQSRTDFPMFLKRISEYIRYPGKFSRSMTLIATKVKDPYSPTQEIVDGILGFIESVHGSAPDIFSDPVQLENSRKILEALLDDQNGTSPKIGIFRQPLSEGSLNSMDVMTQNRRDLAHIIWNLTEFVEQADEDFGVSLSGEAKLVVVKLAERANQNIVTGVKILGSLILRHFEDLGGKEGKDLYLSFDEMNRGLTGLINGTESLITEKSIGHDFAPILTSSLTPLIFSDDLRKQVDQALYSLAVFGDRLDFFNSISDRTRFYSQGSNWALPLEGTIKQLKFQIHRVAQSIDTYVLKSCSDLSNHLMNLYKHQVTAQGPTLTLQRDLDQDYRNLVQGTEVLEHSSSITNFFDKLTTLILSLTLTSSSSSPPDLPDLDLYLAPFRVNSRSNKTLDPHLDLNFDPDVIGLSSPYKPYIWAGKLKSVILYLQEERARVFHTLSGKKCEEGAKELTLRIENLEREKILQATHCASTVAQKEELCQREIEILKKDALQARELEVTIQNLTSDLTSCREEVNLQNLNFQKQEWDTKKKVDSIQFSLDSCLQQVKENEVKIGAVKELTSACERAKEISLKDVTDLKRGLDSLREQFRKCEEIRLSPPPARARLFPYKNFEVKHSSVINYDSKTSGRCRALSSSWLESVDSQGTCIRLYLNNDCSGTHVVLQPGTYWHWDVRKLFVMPSHPNGVSPQSAGPCI